MWWALLIEKYFSNNPNNELTHDMVNFCTVDEAYTVAIYDPSM